MGNSPPNDEQKTSDAANPTEREKFNEQQKEYEGRYRANKNVIVANPKKLGKLKKSIEETTAPNLEKVCALMDKDWEDANVSADTLETLCIKCQEIAVGTLADVEQPTHDLYDLRHVYGPQIDPLFGNVLTKLVIHSKHNAHKMHAPLKHPDRIAEKYVQMGENQRGGVANYSFACDIVRGTIVYETVEQIVGGLKYLQKNPDGLPMSIVEIKDRVTNPQGSYRDVKLKLKVKTREIWMICELQLHTKVTIKRKEDLHKYYDLKRKFEIYQKQAAEMYKHLASSD